MYYLQSHIRHNDLGNYTVEPVYNGHPWDLQKWLICRGDLIIQSGVYVIYRSETNLGLKLLAVIHNRVADHLTQVTIEALTQVQCIFND